MTLISWVRSALQWLWGNKLRLALSIASAVIFTILLFPFNDLSDLLSRQISVATRNSVSVQFGTLDLSFFPQLGAQAEKVSVDSAFFPGMTIEELTITPSLRGLIAQKPLGHVTAKGLFKGEIDAKLSSGKTSERGAELHQLDITAKKISLEDLRALGQLPLVLKGRLDAQTSGLIDLTLTEQPEVDLNLKVDRFEMPPSTLAMGDLGELALPEIRISAVEMKGRIANGRLYVESLKVGGQPADDLLGMVKGNMTMNFRGGPTPELGSYTFDVDLQPSASFRERAKFFLEFLGGYRQGDRYRLKISGSQLGAPPSMSALQ